LRSPTSVCFNLTVTSAPAERRNHRGQDRRNAELHQSNTGRELNDRAIKGLTRAVPAEYRVDGIGTCSLIGFCEAIRNGHDLVNDRQPLAPPQSGTGASRQTGSPSTTPKRSTSRRNEVVTDVGGTATATCIIISGTPPSKQE
jgi:hypothetical protein